VSSIDDLSRERASPRGGLDKLRKHVAADLTQTPALIGYAGASAQTRFLEFFAAQILNKHTRRAYAQATRGSLRSKPDFSAAGDQRPRKAKARCEKFT
jgi:hypothetical protein